MDENVNVFDEDFKDGIYVPRNPKKRVPRRKNNLTKFIASNLIKGILAGIMISIGCIAYLGTSKYLGPFLFSVGFFAIYSYGFNLFTAKIGYLPVNNKNKNWQLIPMWFGNLIGALIVGYLVRITEISETLTQRASQISAPKLGASAVSVFVLAIFCGVLMFVSADNFKNSTNNVQKYLAIILPAAVLPLCGFETCVANTFFFSAANCWSFKAFLYIVIMTLGNAVGAIIIPICHTLVSALRPKRENKQ